MCIRDRPGIDARFRANGVDLMGSAAFLTAPQPKSADIYELSARALTCAAPALDVKDEARLTASAAKAAGCTAYLTGSFSFDRRMGSAVPMLRKVLLEDYGLPSYSLESDFWCESGSPMPVSYTHLYDEVYDMEYVCLARSLAERGIPLLRLETNYSYTPEATALARRQIENFVGGLRR